MSEIRLDTLLAERSFLRPGEVVTVVASVAGELARWHAAGAVHGSVTAAAIELDATGRPRLRVPSHMAPGADREGDVRALAELGSGMVGPYPPRALVAVLHEAAVTGTAAALAAKVLGSCRAEPVRTGVARTGESAGDASTGAAPTPAVPPRLLPPGRAAPPGQAVPPTDPFRPGALRRPVAPTRAVPRWQRVASAGAEVVRGRGRPLAVALVPLLVLAGALLWEGAGRDRPAAAPTATRDSSTATRESSSPPGATPDVASPSPTHGTARSWRARLAELDRRRSVAYGAGDVAGLRDVYVPGSRALASDSATLRRYARAGLRVGDLRLRLLAVRARTVSPTGATLSVTDRLPAYDVVDAEGRVVSREPGRGAVSWRLTLRRVGGAWLIADVRRAG